MTREYGRAEWPVELTDLYRENRVELVRLAYLITGHATVAEELVHDAFIATLQSWSTVRQPHQYVQRAVVNRCRSWGRHQQVVQANPPPPPKPSVQEPDELWDAMGRLPERRRAAIVLRYYLGLPHAKIAAILGCQPATVRTTIHRGLKQLGEEIDR